MAFAMKCDRCGKYYEYRPMAISCVALIPYRIGKRECRSKEEFDLCPDCVESFNEWFIKKDYIK